MDKMTHSWTKDECCLQVIELLKTGKGKEVSYNALATHIIAEDGDNPEVGESREVFDLPVIKVTASHIRIHLKLDEKRRKIR